MQASTTSADEVLSLVNDVLNVSWVAPVASALAEAITGSLGHSDDPILTLGRCLRSVRSFARVVANLENGSSRLAINAAADPACLQALVSRAIGRGLLRAIAEGDTGAQLVALASASPVASDRWFAISNGGAVSDTPKPVASVWEIAPDGSPSVDVLWVFADGSAYCPATNWSWASVVDAISDIDSSANHVVEGDSFASSVILRLIAERWFRRAADERAG